MKLDNIHIITESKQQKVSTSINMIGAFDELFALVNFSLSNIKVFEPRKLCRQKLGHPFEHNTRISSRAHQRYQLYRNRNDNSITFKRTEIKSFMNAKRNPITGRYTTQKVFLCQQKVSFNISDAALHSAALNINAKAGKGDIVTCFDWEQFNSDFLIFLLTFSFFGLSETSRKIWEQLMCLGGWDRNGKAKTSSSSIIYLVPKPDVVIFCIYISLLGCLIYHSELISFS